MDWGIFILSFCMYQIGFWTCHFVEKYERKKLNKWK